MVRKSKGRSAEVQANLRGGFAGCIERVKPLFSILLAVNEAAC